MAQPEQRQSLEQPGRLVRVPLPYDLDEDWCGQFSLEYGNTGLLFSSYAKSVIVQDTPPEYQPAHATVTYDAVYIPSNLTEGDLIEGRVVGARRFPKYNSGYIDDPDWQVCLTVADAYDVTQDLPLSRTPGDLVNIPIDTLADELTLYS